jgi:hypothetical protein
MPVCLIGGALCVHLCHAQTEGQDSGDNGPISGGANVVVSSQYVWRGIILENQAVIQPMMWTSDRHFTFSLWNSRAFDHPSDAVAGDELDFAVAYETVFIGMDSEVSFGYYLYPHQADAPSTGEVTATLSVPFSLCTLQCTNSIDVIHYHGAYYGEASLALPRNFSKEFTGELSAYAGWASAEFNDVYAASRQASVNSLGTRASLDYRFGGGCHLAPSMEWCRAMFADAQGRTPRSLFILGTTFEVEF